MSEQLDKENAQLDPFWQQREDARRQEISDIKAGLSEENAPDPESFTNPEEPEESRIPEDKGFHQWSHDIPVVGPINKVLDSASLGVGDFAADAIGLVPWLKPIDDWWDKNSPRSKSPMQKMIRDASSVIIPSMVGGTWVVGGAKAAIATKAITLPGYAHTLGTIAAYTGVDTGVSMISSHSKEDDNLAGTLNQWLGTSIPWGTRPGDDPDVRWKKNVFESAGLAGGGELLGAAFTFGKKARLFPRNPATQELIDAKKLDPTIDPLTKAVKPRMESRKAAQLDEAVEAIKADPTGLEYNAFVNDLGPDDAGRAVSNLEADPLQAKLHQAQIQNNQGTINGRAAPVADEAFNRQFLKAISGNERAVQLDQLFDSISPEFDAVVTTGAREVQITSEQMNRSVDNLTQAIYGQDVSFREFIDIVDDMKITVFNSNQILDEEAWVSASAAFKEVYETIFDPNQMRASAMLTQQAGDTVSDAAAAAKMLGDNADTSRQFEMMFDKMNLLDNELKINKYITNKAKEYQRIKQTGSIEAGVSWLNKTTREFDTYIERVLIGGEELRNELISIAKTKPHFFDALKDAYFATDGEVNSLHKLHKWTDANLGILKKAFIDGEPEVPSLIVKGLHAARINSLLSGLSSARAMVGNSMLTFAKPVSVFVGAGARGDMGTLKRAWYTYGGWSENLKRGFKVAWKEWKLASAFPEEAMMRGRADMKFDAVTKLEALESTSIALEKEGELGKVAAYNAAKLISNYNKHPLVRYGTNALYAIDGFTNSFMASGMARARAYDQLLEETGGAIDFQRFTDIQRGLYDEAFDNTGLLTDEAARFAAREIALNLDNKVVKELENFMDLVPAAKGIFMFPRTGVNSADLAWSFSPTSALGPAMTRARKTLDAKSAKQKLDVLFDHGIDAYQDADAAFNALKSEYLGRQLMGFSVAYGAGMWALEGNLTGNGPQDAGEKARMMQMGWKPLSVKNPITGEWRSYKGFAPFDKVLGMVGDAVYQAKRVDQAVTEDWFRKIGYSISMNVTNDTFISGFEPLVGLISGDPSAWTRFWAGQVDMLTPYKGARSILNNIITPQMKDVENNMAAYIMNHNKFLFQNGEEDDPLRDQLDIYTGEPIRYYDTFTAAANAVLPFFKTNGDMEPWRQWLLATGWDGLQKLRQNKDTKLPLSSRDRYYINNWIAKHAGLRGQILSLMTKDDGWWDQKIREYAKARGLKTQNQFPIKQLVVHKELDRIHDEAVDAAWLSLQAYREQYTTIGSEIRNRDFDLQSGDIGGAAATQQRINDLQQMVK